MADPRTVLVIEDDEDQRTALSETLSEHGFVPTGVPNLAEARAALASHRPHAVLVDVGLPDGDGRELCAWLRKEAPGIPLLILTGLSDEAELVRGFDAGACDWIAKPFRASELIARLRAQLRLSDHSEHAAIPVGHYSFRPGQKVMIDNQTNRKVRLTGTECSMLKRLLAADGGCVSRPTLLVDVWGYNSTVTTHTVETHIYRLRRKLEVDPANPVILVSQPGGYQLVTRPQRRSAARLFRVPSEQESANAD
jgi:DNA-binding response OmpR family regulator